MSTMYDFGERLRFSQGHDQRGVTAILLDRVPNATGIRRASEVSDRQGTDYWVDRDHGHLPPLSVDVKVREEDWAAKPAPFTADDLALETWSSIGSKVGWTRDPDKRTDYILWWWCDTGRFFLVPFHPLCHVFSRKWSEWQERYKTRPQPNAGWTSECVFVPRIVVVEALNRWSDGRTKSTTTQPAQLSLEVAP